jgi:uncharacterized repeat protein (TIGR01451 family)
LVTIPVGGTVTFSVTAQIASGATGSITNTTTITAPGSVVDPVLGNNSATDTDTLAPQADISVVKTGPPTVASGGPISYSLLVSNAGASDANAAAYSDFVPAGITARPAARRVALRSARRRRFPVTRCPVWCRHSRPTAR